MLLSHDNGLHRGEFRTYFLFLMCQALPKMLALAKLHCLQIRFTKNFEVAHIWT
jgi:hypothetical protein